MKLRLELAAAVAALVECCSAWPSDQPFRQIAIIGAGAAGSSAAYFLRNYTTHAGFHVNITLFEKTDRIGGRTLTVNPFNDLAQLFELGASIFVPVNHILNDSVTEFNLSTRAAETDSSSIIGIWDGDRFVFTLDRSQPSWWKGLKVALRYGLTSPWRAEQFTAATIAKFLRIYDAPFFPFPSLTQRAQDLGLDAFTGVTGEQVLKENKIGALYAHDVVQASTRVNYASNIAVLHGLHTLVSLAANGAIGVRGGNWQIFSEMARRSSAFLALNTTVVAIDKGEDAASDRPRYTLQTTSGIAPDDTTTYPVAFDNVIIATPYQFSGMSAGLGVLDSPIEAVPYVELHVTIFTSPSWFSPRFFGLRSSQKPPGLVLTTLASTDTPDSGVAGAGKAGFFSLSNIGKAINPKTLREENVYKVFSPEALTPDFLSRLLGSTVPETFTGEASPITWYHAHVFHSYPKAYPRVKFQDPVVGQGVYYTAGMESFISTMETNALMGKNVARLIVDDMLITRSSSGLERGGDGVAWEDKQRILN
ncbi:uncharacterized protein THITE_2145487 [Thermothielavioides terrestris NRRL 8126]|uniref:Prenylcysteine lyase domain-containing protein n=1 Tax=Thermothielavioides terrestris (strain ATCC 38088 / NRRL 8126) TaxID=578455 RepID=G2R5L6_THETT|nr:uncharacterized protein THITE_2145487 [Thermothielavioides terrestris NRRL 8126]AEO68308.1 hypothetical protein THITE_2145487 [Thermothielavioides terrestris NRRL 8126]